MPRGALQVASHLGNSRLKAGASHPQGTSQTGSMFLFCSRSAKSQMDSSYPWVHWSFFRRSDADESTLCRQRPRWKLYAPRGHCLEELLLGTGKPP
jgi:hypothetical protein